jgi:integrase
MEQEACPKRIETENRNMIRSSSQMQPRFEGGANMAKKGIPNEVKLYRENDGKIRFLTEDEETLLLANCSPTLKPIVITGLHTGFRKSEVLSLTWANVDFQHRLITVEAAYAKKS